MKKLMKLTTLATFLVASAAQAGTLNFTMGSTSGSTYAIGVHVGEAMKKEGDYNINVKSGGALGNVILIGRGRADFGHSSSGLAFAAENGTEPFKEPIPNIRGLAKVMESTFQMMMLANMPVNSLAEVKEKKYPLKIAVGSRGQELELLSRRILEVNGITYDDIESWGGRVEFVDINDASSLIRDGHLEAVTMLSGLPFGPIVEINSAREMKFVSLSGETVSNLVAAYGYTPAVVPGGTYDGIDTPAKTVAGGVVLLTNDAVSDVDAYRMTKALCSDEGRENLASLSNSIKTYLVSAEACAAGVGVPLHPGAEKYFREIGALQ